ncbi:MAG: universal stress protein [Haloarculaceae archaeon]
MYRVLLPIDNDEDRARTQAQAVRRLPGGTDEIEVTVLHVFDDEDREETTSLRQLPSGKVVVDELQGNGISVTTESRVGDAAEQILAVGDEIEAELIVMGGRKRSPLGALLFGSVSQAVITDATRPVTITGDVIEQEPSHRCESCGETYYTDPDAEIETCRNCGGNKVRPIGREEATA